MLSKKRDGRHGGILRNTPWRLLPVLLTMSLLIPVQNAFAAPQITSGTVQLSNVFQYGSTAYSVDYSYPSTAHVGTNLSITVTLHVLSLGGTIEYITNYRIIVDVYIGTLHVQNGSAKSNINASFLYPGATWGPNNVTIPLSAGNTGLAEGASANASVKITLQNFDYVHYFAQFIYTSEPAMQGFAGGLLIQNTAASTSTSETGQGSGQTYLPYALLASGAVLMLLAVALPRSSRLPQGNPK
jgi:hypothetical protein